MHFSLVVNTGREVDSCVALVELVSTSRTYPSKILFTSSSTISSLQSSLIIFEKEHMPHLNAFWILGWQWCAELLTTKILKQISKIYFYSFYG